LTAINSSHDFLEKCTREIGKMGRKGKGGLGPSGECLKEGHGLVGYTTGKEMNINTSEQGERAGSTRLPPETRRKTRRPGEREPLRARNKGKHE